MQGPPYYYPPQGFPGRGAGPGGLPFPGPPPGRGPLPPYAAYPAHPAHPAYFPPPGPFRGAPPSYRGPPGPGAGPVYAAPPPAVRNRAPPAPPPTPTPGHDPRTDDDPIHYVYVKVDPAGERAADQVSRELTLRLLKYIHDNLAVIREMGVAVRVEKLSPELLANRSVFDALLAKGITRLPALKTPENVYVGLDPIVGVYEENIRMFLAERRRGDRPPATPDAADEDPLESMYRDEMTLERAEKDRAFEGENGFEEGTSDMMEAHRAMLERRDKSSAASRRRLQSGGGTDNQRPSPLEDGNVSRRPPSRREEPPLSRPPSSRGDNVGGAARARPARDPSDDGDISDTIDRLAREIDSGTLSRAYSSQSGDPGLEDDNAGDDRDAVMEAKYWANQQHTDDY